MTTHTAASPDTPRIDAETTVWIGEIQAEIRRLASAKFYFNEFDADDIASEVVERFLADAEYHMLTTPSALVYARKVFVNAGRNWQRSERAQRCQGADLVRDEFGSLRPAREVVSLDVPITAGAAINFLDRLRADVDIEAIVIEDGARDAAIEAAFAQLTTADRSLLEAVHVADRDREEICRQLGCTDAAFRQRLTRARRQFIAAFELAAELHVAVLVPLAG